MQKLKYTPSEFSSVKLRRKYQKLKEAFTAMKRKNAYLAKGKQSAYCEFGDAAKRCFKDYERKFNGEGI